MEKSRAYYLDILRVAACLAVVMIHVSGYHWTRADVSSVDWQVYNCFDSVSRWAVPVFVMISGSLFLSRDKPLRAILRDNVMRLVLAYVAWGICYAIADGACEPAQFVWTVLMGHYHMWYIPRLIGLYLLTPLLRPIARDRQLARYYLLLGLVFAVALPFATNVVWFFSETTSSQLNALVNKLGLKDLLGFALYYVLGYRLHVMAERPPARRLGLLLAGTFAVTIVGTAALSLALGEANGLLHSSFSPTDVAASILVFALAKSLFVDFVPDAYPRSARIVAALAPLTFGVYLAHPLLLGIIRSIPGLTASVLGPVGVVLLTFLLVVLASFATAAVLKRIPVINRFAV